MQARKALIRAGEGLFATPAGRGFRSAPGRKSWLGPAPAMSNFFPGTCFA